MAIVRQAVALFPGPGVREGPHVEEIAARETAHVWKLGAQVPGQLVDDLRSPAVYTLTLEKGVPERPVQDQQFGIRGACSP